MSNKDNAKVTVDVSEKATIEMKTRKRKAEPLFNANGEPTASTLRTIEQANRGEGNRISYEEFLDRVERQSPSLKAKFAKWRKDLDRLKCKSNFQKKS